MRQRLKVLMGTFYVPGDSQVGFYLRDSDPNEFGLALLTFLADLIQKDNVEIPGPLTESDLNKVRLFHSQKDASGGYRVTLVAPSKVWMKAKKAFGLLLDSRVTCQGKLV